MQRITLFMIVAVTTFPYLADGDRFGRNRLLPGIAGYVPELLSALAVVLVVAVGARDRFVHVRPAYWIAFGALLLMIICGILVNGVDSGPIFAGLRTYLRAIPWFLLPALFVFSEKQLRRQILLMLCLCLLQVPIAAEQRIHTANSSWGIVAITGDWTTGTLGDSGALSIFLVSASCVLVATYEKGLLSFWKFLPLFLLMLIPTTLNETKATIIFLPVGVVVAMMVAARPGTRGRKVLLATGILVLFGAIFVPVYDALNADREYSTTLGDFFGDSNNLKSYLGGSPSRSTGDPGRADAVIYPLHRLSEDPATLVFGYGLGNVSPSNFGPGFNGEHAREFLPYLQSTFARFVLELGLLGMAFIAIIFTLIFQDCLWVSRNNDSILGALAAGMAGIVPVLLLGFFYALVETYPAVSYLFWYLAGLVAAQRMRQTLAQRPVGARMRPLSTTA